jgi:hypothetical protein
MPPPGPPDTTWTATESSRLVRAVGRAPVWGGMRPWTLSLDRRTALLHEMPGSLSDTHSDAGALRGGLMSCGAAVTNLRLAIRSTGWNTTLEFVTRPSGSDVLAVARADRYREPTVGQLAQYHAIDHVDHERRAPRPRPTDPLVARRLTTAQWCPGVRLHALADPRDAAVLATLVAHAGRYAEGPEGLIEEIAAWTGASARGGATAVRAGASVDPAVSGTEPSAGPYPGPLGRSPAGSSVGSHLSALCAAAARIASEQVFLVLTEGDGRVDQMLAGCAVQSARLAAHGMGVVATPVLALLHQAEVRAALLETLGLAGVPQALLRVSRIARPHDPATAAGHGSAAHQSG